MIYPSVVVRLLLSSDTIHLERLLRLSEKWVNVAVDQAMVAMSRDMLIDKNDPINIIVCWVCNPSYYMIG